MADATGIARRIAFARTALAAGEPPGAGRHLAWMPPDASYLDLSDPAQRALGDYEIEAEIGRGGMGVVYRARQKSLARGVALKLLAASPWAADDFIARFREEAQAAAALHHPNIVTVHEIGQHQDWHYYSMHLVEGPSLSQHLRASGAMRPDDAARVLRAMAEAVDYAHRLGVLHLDLKPGNVLLDRDGEPRIADFGLARRFGHVVARSDDEVSGTPSYMAPEQADPTLGPISRATDVWGLGTVLYECLTARPAYAGRDAGAVLEAVLQEAPLSPRTVVGAIPRDLEAICLKCLSRAPPQRYASARALADDLSRFLERRPVEARPLGLPARTWRAARREPGIAALALLALALLIGGLGATAGQWRIAEHHAKTANRRLWDQRLEAVWQAYQDQRWYDALPLLAANLREQEGSGAHDAAAAERLRIGTLLASAPRLVGAVGLDTPLASIALSPDGRWIAAGDERGAVHLVDATSLERLWRVDAAPFPRAVSNLVAVAELAFTPDGRHVVATRRWPRPLPRPSGQSMVLIAVADGAIVPTPATFGPLRDATYGSDGRHALLRGLDQRVQHWHVDPWHALGPVAPLDAALPPWLVGVEGAPVIRLSVQGIDVLAAGTLAPQGSVAADCAVRPLAWAMHADVAAFGDTTGRVCLLDVRSGKARLLRQAADDAIVALRFSGDGRWLAAAAGGEVRVWRATDGVPMMAPLDLAEHVTDLAIDVARATLLVVADGQVRLWRVPASPRQAAMQLGPRLGDASRPLVAALDAARDRLVTAGTDGRLREWRFGAGARVHAASLAPVGAELRFDGAYVAAVEGRVVRVVPVRDDATPGPVLTHPQPVHFAELGADGRTVVAASGTEIHVWDRATARLRFAPIVLSNTPQRFALGATGERLATAYPRHGPEGHREVLEVWDLGTGRRLATHALPGPLGGWRLGSDERALVAWSERALWVLDTDAPTIRSLAPPMAALPVLPDDNAPSDRIWSDAWLDRAGVFALRTRAEGAATGDELWRWKDGTALAPLTLPQQASRLALAASVSRLAIGAPMAAQLSGADQFVPLPGHAGTHAAPPLAYSPDGRLLARALQEGVIVSDTQDGRASAPLLALPDGYRDPILDLAFAPDSSALLARTRNGRAVTWALANETRAVEAIEADVARFTGAAAITDRDAVASMSVPPTPAPPPATGWPARDAAAPARLLDLTAFYNRALDAPPASVGTLSAWRFAALPRGLQRFLDVDYDVRGAVVLSMPGLEEPGGPYPARIDGIPVTQHAAALHVLGASLTKSADHGAHVLGRVVLRYDDGSEAVLPLRWGREFVRLRDATTGQRAEPRIAWQAPPGTDGENPLASFRLAGMRLVNPHPERRIATLALESTNASWSAPVFVALTVEPSP